MWGNSGLASFFDPRNKNGDFRNKIKIFVKK